MKKGLMKLGTVAGFAGLAIVGFQFANNATAAPAEKVTICHAAGQADTDQYVQISTKALSPLGAFGHIDANGTPFAGHEQDFISTDGNCDCTDGVL